MREPRGYLALVLHAHLPFVRHPEYNDPMEEYWLHEAITETYIPLLTVFNKLIEENIDYRVTMSFTPPLVSMLKDPLLQERYLRYINKMIGLIEKEVTRTKFEPDFNRVAVMYREKFHHARHMLEQKYNRDIIEGFRQIQDAGKLEIITCGATHGFFPLMLTENEVNAQVKTAVDSYTEHFGRKPRGIWLPECGYVPGHDEILKKHGIKYFITDTHGILYGSPGPRYGIFAPVFCKSGVAAFGRDADSSKQVWSAKEGYPGDFAYREFYRDVGYDLDYDYIKPYIHESGIRMNTGIKYYKITGKAGLSEKAPYDPREAMDKAANHAGNFMFNREKQAEYLSTKMNRPPLIAAPYDAELFGHWWYEGPSFLDFLLRKIFYDQDKIKTITPPEYLEKYPKNQVITPSASSWGYKGYSEFWLNGANDWVYKHLHKAAERMKELTEIFKGRPLDEFRERALKQAAREVLLAQSSDWAFIMKTQTMVDYAVKRTKNHISRFTALYEMLKQGNEDFEYLEEMERKDNIFPGIDWTVFG